MVTPNIQKAPAIDRSLYISLKQPQQTADPDSPTKYQLPLIDFDNKLHYKCCTASVYQKVLKLNMPTLFGYKFRLRTDTEGIVTDISAIPPESGSTEEASYDVKVLQASNGDVVILDYPNTDESDIEKLRTWFEENKERRIVSKQRVLTFEVTSIRSVDGETEYCLSFA